MLEDVHFNGWLRDPEDARDYRLRFAQDTPLPRQVDLRDRCTPVEDQRHIGSCVANAVVGAAEYLESVSSGNPRPPDLSRLFVYFNARYLHGAQTQDSGTFVRAAMASLAFYGVCLESIWPYDPNRYAEAPPPEAYRDAERRQGLEYARLRPGDEIKRALAEGFPVAFGTAIPKACYTVAATNGGRLPMPDTVPQEEMVGHAMLLVGYDLDQGHYILRNSWGEGWGDRGYGYAPLPLIDTYPESRDFWVLRRLERDGAYQVIRPASTAGRRCPACGAELSSHAKFCPACGKPQPADSVATPSGLQSAFDEIDRRRDQAQQDLERRMEENRRRLQADIDRLLGRKERDE
jgi:C1A family cysteine protease